MGNDFKNNIKSNIKKENEAPVSNNNATSENENKEQVKKFKIGKKQEDKSNKKAIPLYVDAPKQKELDKVVKKTGYSRNELINMMIDFCLENIEFTD